MPSMEKQIGIIGLGDIGHSVALEMEIMRLREAGIDIVMVDDLMKEKESDMVEDFINHMTNIPKIDILPELIVNGGFSESDKKKAIAKKEWKQMTYEERKRLKG